MSYSQKYCLVSFLQPITTGAEFNMADWPLHITLADVFAIDCPQTDIKSKLTKLISKQPVVKTFADKESTLGTTEVILLGKSDELIALHMHLIDLLEKNGAKFNTPEFTRVGFRPHCTIQKSERLQSGDEVTINTITLIDMFPNENWQQRKVLSNFKLND